MSDDLATLLAKSFIQRRDVKAVQTSRGYMPVVSPSDGQRIAWKMKDITEHLNGARTYGHYLLDADSKCKLFAFDIDLKENKPADSQAPFEGYYPELPDITGYPDLSNDDYNKLVKLIPVNPREAWRDRRHPSRSWTKLQFRSMTSMIARTARDLLDIKVATAYSGNKGVHVYCFTGPVNASEAREGAQLVLDALGALGVPFVPERGKAFFRHDETDPLKAFHNFSIEIFPKQDDLGGKDLGNLMRLPLGRNVKTQDPTFFIDERLPLGQFAPHPDPVRLLETGNPWL